jgi:hypothetical protein
MSRYVLVEFESNEAADQFVAKTIAKTARGAHYRVIGFFAKPRNFCECGPLTERQQGSEVTRGAKYGWMVHRRCGRPRRQASHSPRNLMDPVGTYPRDTTSYLHLVGEWAGTNRVGTLLENFPIAVKTREDDK